MPLLWTAIFVVWSAAAAWMDLRGRRVWWVWPIIGFLAAGIFRIWQWTAGGFVFDQVILIAATTTAGFQLWRAKVWGGADAKTAMVLVLASPDWQLVLVLALVDLAVIVGLILARDGWGGLQAFGARTRTILRGEAVDTSSGFPLVAVMTLGYWIFLLFIN